MFDDLDTRVVTHLNFLHGSNQSDLMQKVATVYIDGYEYRVWAPSQAKGPSVDWIPHFSVRRLVDFRGEEEVRDAHGVLALKAVENELKKQKSESNRTPGRHPDGLHCDAQLCQNGHIQSCDGTPFDKKSHCTQCGEACIDECPGCNAPIRGVKLYTAATEYSRPKFCHGCGKAYPWMESLLRTARQLLRQDEKLTQEDRDTLYEDLKYVMSDPKAPLVPAKKKLIEIALGKASPYAREALLDLAARTAAELLKG